MTERPTGPEKRRRPGRVRVAVVLVSLALSMVVLELAVPLLRPDVAADTTFRMPEKLLRIQLGQLLARFGPDAPFPRPPRVEGRLSIGVFGGSVAHNLASSWGGWSRPPDLVAPALATLAARSGRTPAVVDLAVSGTSQPSQYVLARLSLDRLDALVLLDGFNEQFTDMPACADAARVFDAGVDASDLFRPIQASARRLGTLPDSPAWPLVYGTNLGRFWLFDATLSFNVALDRTLRTVGGRLPLPNPVPVGERVAARVAHWEACVVATHAMATAAGVPAWFFVQPNQYVPGSKPMSPAEAKVALARLQRGPGAPDDGYAALPEAYVAYDAAVARLRAQSIRARSLARLFEGVEAPLYVDDCCHVNDRGNALIGRGVIDQLLEDGFGGAANLP